MSEDKRVWNMTDLLQADREMVEYCGYTTGCTVCSATSGCDIDCIGCRERVFGWREKEREMRARLEKVRDELKLGEMWSGTNGYVAFQSIAKALRMLEAILEGKD